MKKINEFNLECRYPDQKFEIYKKTTLEFTRNQYEITKGIIKWISGILKNKSFD